MSIFDGLYGYEKLMLLCGFILFVFALAAITVMIVQRRDFKSAILLIFVSVVFMGFPGIQAVKIADGLGELDTIRAGSSVPADPEHMQKAQQTLSNLEKRSTGNLELQAKISDGYRAIGEVDKGYQLAQTVLRQKPPAQVQATLVPVLTAKLNEVQAKTPLPGTSPETGGSGTSPVSTSPGGAGASSTTAPVVPAATQQQIARIAAQLQGTGAPLPANTHAALAKAYVALGQPQKAQANVDAALRLNPDIKINPAVLRAARMGSTPRPTER